MSMDKVIAITGASSGIGEAVALRLAGEGATVVLGARREDRLERLAARITEAGGTVAYRSVDVRVRTDLDHLTTLALQRFGRLDALVSNAGIATVAPLDTLLVDDWDNMIDANLKGFLYGVSAALPIFRKQGHGHFVTTVSTSGLQITPGQAVYAGTKNAVRTISEALRQEAGPNLRVTAVSPGYVNTDFADAPDPEIRTMLETNKGTIGLPPDAVAGAIAYALAQPPTVDVNEIVIRPTAQS
jgi:NADP-dependent 3-hydroxy acid dehydrogenase YdfG